MLVGSLFGAMPKRPNAAAFLSMAAKETFAVSLADATLIATGSSVAAPREQAFTSPFVL